MGIRIYKCFLQLSFIIFIGAIACSQTKQSTLNASQLLQDNRNGTVTDLRTNFIWQKCSMGQIGDKDCDGKIQSANWLIATRYCEKLTLADKKWTLPTSQEIITLLSSGYNESPSFPNRVQNTKYWSATSHESLHLIGIMMDMQEQKENYKVKFDTNAVRCIVKHKVKKTELHNHANWKVNN